MRNYIQVWIGNVIYHYDPPPPDPPSPPITIYQLAGTEEDLKQALANAAETYSGAGYTIDSVTPLGPKYFLLDKTNVSRFLATMVSDIGWIAVENTGAFFPDPGTPRDGWKDESGVKREPPPSEGGTGKPASGPQSGNINFKDIITFLLTLYALTYQRGCLGYAAIIASAVKKAYAGTLTQADVDGAARAYNACLARG